MKTSALPLFLSAAVAATAGCRALPEPTCQSRLLVPIVARSGPRQATVGQQLTYTFDVKLGNSCGVVDTVIASQGDNAVGPFTRQVGVRALYNGCSCTTDTLALTRVSYQFRPDKAGTYYLKFLTRQSRFYTDTLLVR